jgi:phage gpG-like protein
MSIMNLLEAGARFAAAAADIEAAKRAALEEACALVEERAKGLLGHPNASWAPLKPETIAQKGGLDMPLLNQGTMRDSIEHTVIDSNHGEVGSNSEIAVIQSLGSSRGIPPRPFLSLAGHLEGPAVAKVVAKTVGAAISGGLAGSRVHDFFRVAHIAGEAFHRVGDLASDLVTSDEEQKR